MLSSIGDIDHYWQALQKINVPIMSIKHPLLNQDAIELNVARFDMVDNELSGNKGFKLLPYLLDAKKKGYKKILSFGGIHSNHLHALAFAAKRFGFSVVAIVRGYATQTSPTLIDLQGLGVKVVFQGHPLYRCRNTPEYIYDLSQQYPDAYMIPEGGKGTLGWQGGHLMADLLYHHVAVKPTILAIAAGTGTTFLGMLMNDKFQQSEMLAYTALGNADDLQKEVSLHVPHKHWHIKQDYCFGGFAKMNTTLATFIDNFERDYKLPLDPVYTGKLMYGILSDIEKKQFAPQSSITILHTGGLQGKRAMAPYIHRLIHQNEHRHSL